MDPERRPLAYLLYYNAYGKPHLWINIHHYAPPRTVLACCSRPGVRATVITAGHCTHAELRAMLWLAVIAVACTPAVFNYGN